MNEWSLSNNILYFRLNLHKISDVILINVDFPYDNLLIVFVNDWIITIDQSVRIIGWWISVADSTIVSKKWEIGMNSK